ncbi:hypothetical protein [Streptomyces sp. NPDC057557]|uniref:hypothetical protein n=1 Tax=Streptomyces sp. NPDC057557 TaxID=3346167 RepID=UPI00368CB183
MSAPDSGNEPSRLRRVRIPGTVPLLSLVVSRRPHDEEEKQGASGTDTTPRAVE